MADDGRMALQLADKCIPLDPHFLSVHVFFPKLVDFVVTYVHLQHLLTRFKLVAKLVSPSGFDGAHIALPKWNIWYINIRNVMSLFLALSLSLLLSSSTSFRLGDDFFVCRVRGLEFQVRIFVDNDIKNCTTLAISRCCYAGSD